jgi:S1-C subfamily serine protease
MEPEQPSRPIWLDPPADPAAVEPATEATPAGVATDETPAATPPPPPPPPAPPSPPNPLPPDPTPASAGATGWLKPAIAGAVVGALVAAGVAGGIVAANDHDGGSTTTRSVTAPVTRSSTQLAGEKLDVAAVLAAVDKGVVAIHVSGTSQFSSQQTESAGSGMIIDTDGLVLTNAHVVAGANSIKVTLSDGREVDADLVGASSSDDVALVRLRDTSNLTAVKLGNSDQLQVGDSVVAVGNALNLGATPTVTTGIVSALNRSIDAENEHLEHLIQTDAAINRGNSGGPLVNAEGEVIGVNTAIAADGQNIGFALAINEVKSIVSSVRNGGGDKTTAFLGVNTLSVSDVSAAVRDRLNIGDKGAFVQAVEPGTAADSAGLQAGDVITKVDDATIDTASALTKAIQGHKPGDKVRVTYVRDGNTKTVTVTLGSKAASSG